MPDSFEWRKFGMLHEWSHIVGLAAHTEDGYDCLGSPAPGAPTVTDGMVNFDGPVCAQNPSAADRDAVRCTVYKRCNNLLRSASFEGGAFSPWNKWETATQAYTYSSPSPHSGSWFLSVYTGVSGGSIYQDNYVALPAPDESYVFSVWARSPSGSCVSGTLVLWAIGGTSESNGTGFNICANTWTLISAPLDVELGGHSGFRAQIYLSTTGRLLNVDTTEVMQVADRNASFERDYGWETPGWWQRGCNPGAINWARYSDPYHPSKTGAWFLEANTTTPQASICEDMDVVPLPGQSYTFSIWLRSPTSQVAQGTVALWALGGSQEMQGTSFTLATTGWVQVTAPLDVVNSGHTGLRAEIYMNTTGRNYDFDGAVVYKNLLSNASFEMGTFSPWDRYETATNYAVYYSPSITHGGGWFAETNTSVTGGSIFQDVAIAKNMGVDVPLQPELGESYTFTIWTRCASTCNVSGSLVLWGRTNDEAQATPFNVNSTFWTPIVVPLDVKVGGHTSMRAQIYLNPGGTLRVDSTGNSPSSGTPSGR